MQIQEEMNYESHVLPEVPIENKKSWKSLLNWKFILLVILGLIVILLVILSLFAQQQIKSLQQQTVFLNLDLQDTVKKVELLDRSVFYASLQHGIEDSVVTEDLVVSKTVFSGDYLLIDVNTQPKMMLKYKGQGKFDLTDREIKGMLDDVLKRVQEYYGRASERYKGSLPLDGIKTVKFTIKNYEIGTAENGKITLKGE